MIQSKKFRKLLLFQIVISDDERNHAENTHNDLDISITDESSRHHKIK